MSDIAILHICLSRGWGGLEMYPIRTGKLLSDKGYRVFGLAIEGTQTYSGMKTEGLNVFPAKSKASLLTKELFSLIRWIKKNHITVVHCHKSGDLLVAALIKSFLDIKIVFTEHMGVKRPKKDLFHKWVYKHVDQVLSISDETYKRNIVALPVPEEKIERLWLGTDIPELITSPERLQHIKDVHLIPENKIIIGTVGRLSPGKGHINLIRAYSKIKQSYPDSVLVIVGGLKEEEGADIEYLAQLQRLIKEEDLLDDVLFTGFCRNIHELYSIMDVVCLPYANEAFGLTAIEAMSAARPILASSTGALPEILGAVGYYCNPNDADDIANQLLAIFSDQKEALQRAQKARNRAENVFSIEKHIQALLNYYK